MNLSILESALCGLGVGRGFYRRQRRSVTIVNYHDPEPERLGEHLRFLAKRYSFVAIDAVSRALAAEDFSDLPDWPLLVTFDDGHRGNYRLLPILKEYGVPAVIYATSGLIGTNRHFWWKELRRKGLDCFIPELKELPLDDFKRRMRALCEFEFEREYDEPDALGLDQLREAVASGLTIAAHSVNHPMLDQCDDESLEYECAESKRRLEEILQREVVHFALPNGNYDQRVVDVLSHTGFLTNRTIDPGVAQPTTDPLQLPNYGLNDVGSRARIELQASGVWTKLRNLRG